MGTTLTENLRMRLAFLNATWEELAILAGEPPGNVRAWVRRGTPRGDTLERLARLLGVPSHALLDPDFNPREHPAPKGAPDGGKDDQETSRHELDDGDAQKVP